MILYQTAQPASSKEPNTRHGKDIPSAFFRGTVQDVLFQGCRAFPLWTSSMPDSAKTCRELSTDYLLHVSDNFETTCSDSTPKLRVMAAGDKLTLRLFLGMLMSLTLSCSSHKSPSNAE